SPKRRPSVRVSHLGSESSLTGVGTLPSGVRRMMAEAMRWGIFRAEASPERGGGDPSMSSPTALVIRQPHLHFERFACAALTGGVGALIPALGPAPGDAAAHLYRTFLVRHGALLWDNFWYAGHYPIAGYSLLYYLPAAVVGNVPLVLGAAVVSTFVFSSIARTEWGDAALWPTRVFGIFAAAPLFTGLYSYSVAFMTLLGSVRALEGGRRLVAVALAAFRLGFSPFALGFLCLLLVSILIVRRQLTVPAVVVAAGIGFLIGFEIVVLRLFPSGGVYPFH